MKNRDYFAKELVDSTIDRTLIGVDKRTGRPKSCENMECHDCKFYNSGRCTDSLREWANQEFTEPIPYINGDLCEVSSNGIDWELRYFNKEVGGIYLFYNSGKDGLCSSYVYHRKYGTLGGLVNEE